LPLTAQRLISRGFVRRRMCIPATMDNLNEIQELVFIIHVVAAEEFYSNKVVIDKKNINGCLDSS
jgi:hypothetical protein